MAEFKIGRLRFVWRGLWTTGYAYVKDDVVRVGGSSYVCITGHTSQATFAADSIKWERMQEGIQFKNTWTTTTIYESNDIVVYGGIAYICTTAHTSTSTFDPTKFSAIVKGFDYKGAWSGSSVAYKLNDLVKYGANIYLCTTAHTSTASFVTDSGNWSLFVPGLEFEDSWSGATTYQRGDIVTYGGYSYVSLQNHINQVPSTATSYWDILTTGYKNEGIWNSIDTYEVGNVVQYGGNVYEAIADNSNTVPTNTGSWKLLVQGLNFLGSWSAGQSYKPGDVVNYGSSSYRVKVAHTSANSGAERPDLDISGVNYGLLSEGDSNYVTLNRGDLIARGASANYNLPIGSAGKVLKSDGTDPIWDYFGVRQKVYYVAPNGTDSVGYGETIDRPWATIAYACANVTGPATINIKTGSYAEALPISVPATVSLVGDELRTVTVTPASGYAATNMFYLRNGSNIRNITMSGLTSSLGAPLPSGTRRTSVSYISLDPGTGPTDNTVWITTKSPYVQNCTTFGTAVCGLKVDGTLHNGGNKSIVANDFTQIIDNGIGVWLNGGAKAELVSVFTYFCYIGYLTTNGGTIRGVNGNNSYGTYGAVSEDGDPTETPQTGTVNNRNNEAIVGNVICAGSQIVLLELLNGGEAYTSATALISGNGAGENITPVFTNGAISRVDITTEGTTHKTALNNAQTGTATSITLSVTDLTPTNAYNGMRITIIDGQGYGQTGIISAYNGGTKVATIVKEDTTPGWDHLIPTGVVETTLNETTRYRIEPRVSLTGGAAPTTPAKLRAVVEAGELIDIYIIDGGEGYNPASPPAIVITDPNATILGAATVSIKNGAISKFTYTNRGVSYTTATATITGDGYADILQTGGYLNVNGLSSAPRPGSNLSIAGDSITYRIVAFTNQTGSSPNISGRLQVSPVIATAPAQSTVVTITERYSNVRLTGHDFLNIGTGGVTTTNYPGTPSQPPAQANEVIEYGGGRVFYTSTDQDGNFRVGELFLVEQATGIATLNADAFNLSGLNQLQLGAVALGGSGVAIREFSADPLLTADANDIVPTQRAVKTFVENIIGAGGSNITANSVTLGGMELLGNQITATGALNLVMTTIDPTAIIVFNRIPTTSVAPTSGTHLTNKTYTDYTYAPTIQNLSFEKSTGRIQYQEEHASTANTVTHVYDSDTTVTQAYIGQERSSFSINAAGHLIITM
jgi:hypothetical protein